MGEKAYMAAWMMARDTGLDVAVINKAWKACGLPETVYKGQEKPVIAELERMGALTPEVKAIIAPPDRRKAPRIRPEVLAGLAGMKAICSYSLDIANIAYMRKNGHASAYLDGLIFADRRAKGDILEDVEAQS